MKAFTFITLKRGKIQSIKNYGSMAALYEAENISDVANTYDRLAYLLKKYGEIRTKEYYLKKTEIIKKKVIKK